VKLALLLASIGLGGCGVLLSPNGPESRAPVVAEMERLGCYGECPIYRVIVYADGVVEFHGEAYVDAIGRRSHRISAQAVADLRQAFDSEQFMRLGDLEHADCTDMPRVQLTYRGKTITHDWGDKRAPESLEGLESIVDELAETRAWIGDEHVFAQPFGSFCYGES
jgi:hypothetical protein